jgi:hypothetical protein
MTADATASHEVVLLTEDFELPATDAEAVHAGLGGMRESWSRGNACLT